MSTVRYRKGGGADGPRISFSFFLAGALVVLVAVFVIGIQVGRVIEKEKLVSPPPGDDSTRTVKVAVPAVPPAAAPSAALPAAKGPVPGELPPLTFPETLEKKDPVVVSLPKEKELPAKGAAPALPAEKKEGGKEAAAKERPAKAEGKGKGKAAEAEKGAVKEIFLQAGVFTDKYGAEAVRKRIRHAGIECTLKPAQGKGGKALHKVLAGPFPDRAAARAAERKLKGAGIDVYLPRG